MAVFEKHRIGDGVTGYTTGKVSLQYGVVYSELIENIVRMPLGITAKSISQQSNKSKRLSRARRLSVIGVANYSCDECTKYS